MLTGSGWPRARPGRSDVFRSCQDLTLTGTILTANIVSVPAQAGVSLDPVTFLDTRRPISRTCDRHYLIVYSAPATFAEAAVSGPAAPPVRSDGDLDEG